MACCWAVRYVILFSFVVASAGGLIAYDRWATQAPRAEDRVIVVRDATLEPPAAEQSGAHVELPHRWSNGSPNRVYTFELSLDVPPNRVWALYIPTVHDDATLRINGQATTDDDLVEWPGRRGVRSLYFVIPNGIIRAGLNELELVVTADPSTGGSLGQLYLGPASVLAPFHQTRLQLHRLHWYSALALVLLALAAWFVARANHEDDTYIYVAVFCIAWAISHASFLSTVLPFDWSWLQLVGHTAAAAAVVTAGLYAVVASEPRRSSQTAHWVRRAMTVFCGYVLVLAVLNATPANQTRWLAQVPVLVLFGLQIGGVFLACLFARHLPKRPTLEQITLLWLGTLAVGLGIFDTAGKISGTVRHVPLMFGISPLIFVLLAYLMFARFSAALRQAETLARTLGASSASDEVASNEIVVRERERIMRDMHDGVGGHLVSSLAILRNRNIEDPDLEELLNQALVDLRLMIDSLEDADGDLGGAIGMLRGRMDRTLAAAGVETRWLIDDVRLDGRGPTDTLQILRILQEALTNVVKHAQARHIVVRAEMASDRLARFVVSDDGKGFDVGHASGGRGLANMQLRARRIGAELYVDSMPEGTTLTLSVPAGARVQGETP